MVPQRPAAFLWIVVALLLLVVTPRIGAQPSAPTPPTISVKWYPEGYPVTPWDPVDIQANVTSSTAIRNVTIYYRIGPFGLRLNSVSDYNNSRMQGPDGASHGTWFYDFYPQKNNSSIYFVVSAFDISGLQAVYPGNQPFSNPQSIQIEFPSKPYLSYVNVYFSTLTISGTVTVANISVSMAAYLPERQEPVVFTVHVFPTGRYPIGSTGSYLIGYMPLYEVSSSRFFYTGKASWLVYLIGPTSQIPYDTYSLNLNLTLPYRFDNLSYALKYYTIQTQASPEIWNSFTIVTSYVPLFTYDNNSVQLVYITLTRQLPTFYPPLVLMLVALAVLGLVPLVSVYDASKRFDMFLNVIILGSSSELSQAIYPATGYYGDNIFLESFALILGATIFMMAVSSLPEKFRTKTLRGLEPEWYTNIGVIAIISYFIWFTNFPTTAKWLTPLLGLSGLFFFGAYRCLPKVVTGLRLHLKRRIKEWKKIGLWISNNLSSSPSGRVNHRKRRSKSKPIKLT